MNRALVHAHFHFIGKLHTFSIHMFIMWIQHLVNTEEIGFENIKKANANKKKKLTIQSISRYWFYFIFFWQITTYIYFLALDCPSSMALWTKTLGLYMMPSSSMAPQHLEEKLGREVSSQGSPYLNLTKFIKNKSN